MSYLSADVCSSDLEDAAARRGDGQVGLGLADAGDVSGELGDLRAHQAQLLGALLGVRAFELARPRQLALGLFPGRSEERRAGKECVSTFRSRWSAYHYTEK